MTTLTVRFLSLARPAVVAAACASLALGCSRFGAVYPPRPAAMPGPPMTDPAPSRLVVHVSVSHDALRSALDAAVPKAGEGDVVLLGSPRHYAWAREPLALRFAQGRLVLGVHVDARVKLPLKTFEVPLDLEIAAEPVMNRDYAVALQSVDVKASSPARSLEVANLLGGVFDALGQAVRAQVEHFTYDVRPLVGDAYTRLVRPLKFPVGDAVGCARIAVLGVEAAPTIIADGLEKDLALVVAPEVTFPCADDASAPSSPPLPPLPRLANVASLPTGPFTLSVPIAASYEELARAMSAAFTGGKLFFSKDYPELFLASPEVYESQGLVVLKLHLGGAVHAMGIDTDLDGDIFFTGHISVSDNELSVPDLEPTIETKSLLLSLKAAAGTTAIRDQARTALRLDLGERLRQVRASLAGDLTFGGKDACFHGAIDKVELASVFAHGTYLRIYATINGRAEATMPCASPMPRASSPSATP